MSRILMISDIHGCSKELNELLDKINYDETKDTLILLGDYVDRGPCSKETVDRVMELVKKRNVIALRGNHDQRLVDFILTEDPLVQNKFVTHGGLQTVQSYCECIDAYVTQVPLEQFRDHMRMQYMHHIDFLSSLPLYHEDSYHVYVHAGLNPEYMDWKLQPDHDFMYIKSDFHRSKPWTSKRVIFGHTRTSELHDTSDVWFGEGKIGIDGGCAYGQQLNCLIYEAGEYTTEVLKIKSDGA